ncbi:MAG: GFA family protein [Salaquimonas sp.]|nr:GFA family protein [Salaquimonas sp.]
MTGYTGRCLCQAVTFRVSAEPQFTGHCHCLDCQKSTGTGHASYAFFELSGVHIKGVTSAYESRADSGATMTRRFCPRCGSRLFGHSSRMPDAIGIMLATFDDPDAFIPTTSLYASKHRKWDPPATDTKAFAEGRPSRD